MQIECTRFRVKKEKSHQVDEWMKMLNDRMPEVLLTLQDESRNDFAGNSERC